MRRKIVITDVSEQTSLVHNTLCDLLVFLKSNKIHESFRHNCLRDIIKLGSSNLCPILNLSDSQLALSAAHKMISFLAAGQLSSLEERFVCAEVVVAILNMFSKKTALTFVSQCFRVKAEARSLVDLTLSEEVDCTFVVLRPLEFKLCFARAILQIRTFLTVTVLYGMAEPIAVACYQYSHLTSVGFRILNMWLSYWNKMEYCLDANSCEDIYSLVANNWQNPLPGVRKEVFKTFSTLIEVSCQNTKFTAESILAHVIKDMSWKMKNKYFYLTVLMPKVGVAKVLEEYPDVVPAMINTLNAHHLSYSGADLYRVCLAEFSDEEAWCMWFQEPVLKLLTSQNVKLELARQNLLSRWFPPTLKRFPSLTTSLLNHFISLEMSGTNVDLPLSALLHQGRKEGYIGDLLPTYPFVKRLLQSADEEVRKNAFGAVCKRAKRSVLPSPVEFEMVKKFLSENINIDSGPLRQILVDSFSYFVERLRESSERLVPEAKTNNDPEALLPTLIYLNWLHEFLMKNLEIGGNYQRKVASLQLYLEVLKCFGPGQVKESCPTNCVRLFAEGLHVWKYNSESSWKKVFQCILDPSDDIQQIASLIISNHLGLLDEDGELERAQYMVKAASDLCNSHLFYQVESGTVLVKLISQFIEEMPRLSSVIPSCYDKINELEYKELLPDQFWDLSVGHESDSCKKDKEGDISTLKCSEVNQGNVMKCPEGTVALRAYIEYCLDTAYTQLDAVRNDLFQAITSGSPFLGAVSSLVPLVPHFLPQDVSRAQCLAAIASDHFLSLLAPSHVPGDAFSPSFAAMTEAVEQLLPEAEDEVPSQQQLSPSHQLVLSCLWLSLKACCSLSAALFCLKNTSGMLALHCLTLVQKVLLRCRHKGTIESAGTALGVMVRHVTSPQETRSIPTATSNKSETLLEILEKMLVQVLESVFVYSAKTSITRRSAGVGILVHRIVAMDSRPDKPLLTVCVRRLCLAVDGADGTYGGVSNGVEAKEGEDGDDDDVVDEEESDRCDEPRAAALHLLVRLAQDASLRTHTAPLASALALVGLTAFLHHKWTVRNAALQLWGALVPLLLGEKKVTDDDAEAFGCTPAEELLAHRPALMRILTLRLQRSLAATTVAKPICSVATEESSTSPSPQHKSSSAVVFNAHMAGVAFIPSLSASSKSFSSTTTPTLVPETSQCTDPCNTVDRPLEELYHKDVVPVLSLLSKLTIGDSWSTGASSPEVTEMRSCFRELMKSTDQAVRKLAAKAFSRFLPPECVSQSLLQLIEELRASQPTNSGCLMEENEVHGILICLQYLVNRLAEDGASEETFKFILQNFTTQSVQKRSWLNRSLEIEIILKLEVHSGYKVSHQNLVNVVTDALKQVKQSCGTDIGVWSWATQCINYAARTCKGDEVCYLWTIVYAADWPELAECFLTGVQNHSEGRGQFLLALVSSVFEKKCKESSLLCAIYTTILSFNATERISFSPCMYIKMMKAAKREAGVKSWSIALPLASELFSLHVQTLRDLENEDSQFLELLASEIKERSSPLCCDSECRAHAARAFVALYKILPHLCTLLEKCRKLHCYLSTVFILLESGIALLQDEDSMVRKEAAKFVVPERNSYVCLLTLLSVENLYPLLMSYHLGRFFMSKLFDFSAYEEALHSPGSEYELLITVSPFDQGTSNIYAEEAHILRVVSDGLQQHLSRSLTWTLDMHPLPDHQELKRLVTNLLPQWNSPTKEVDLHLLLIRLEALTRISQMVRPSEAQEYKAILDFASSFREWKT